MRRKFIAFLGIITISWGVVFGLFSTPVEAAEPPGTCGTFLGLVPWYDGLTTGGCTEIASPNGGTEGTELAAFVWTIIANVLIDLFVAIGYLATGFIVYGGYLYIMSDGDPGKMTKGKKTLISAIVGLIIAILANVIIRTLMTILGGE